MTADKLVGPMLNDNPAFAYGVEVGMLFSLDAPGSMPTALRGHASFQHPMPARGREHGRRAMVVDAAEVNRKDPRSRIFWRRLG
jgi:hypothetical protein